MKNYEKPTFTVFLIGDNVKTLFSDSSDQKDNDGNDLDNWGIKIQGE